MKRIFLIIIAVLVYSSAYSQNDGAANTGLAFLKLGAGAKNIAMGEAVVSITDDASAMIYNPSRLTFGTKGDVTVMHTRGMLDTYNNFVASKFGLSDKFTIGVAVVSTSIDDIEIRTAPGSFVDKFSSNNLSVGLTAAYKFSNTISAGVTAKYLYEKIYTDDASGFGYDLGASYVKNNLSFGAAILNIGSVDALKNEESKLPTSLRLGAGYKMPLNTDINLVFGLDGYKVLDGADFHVLAGAQAGYKNTLFLRAGYQSGFENKSFTAGAGVLYGNLRIDYAIVPMTSGFGTQNTFSVGLSF